MDVQTVKEKSVPNSSLHAILNELPDEGQKICRNVS